MNRVAPIRIALWGVLTAVLVLGLVWAFWPRAILVDLAVVTRGPLSVTIDEEGETRIRDVFVLSAPVAGLARRIETDVGDEVVAAETIVVEIEPGDPAFLDVRSETEAKAAVRSANAAKKLASAELERARAERDFATGELDRVQGLFRREVASVRALDAAKREQRAREAAVDAAEAALQRAIFELDRARAQLVSPTETHTQHGACACVPVRSPVSGRVLRVIHESEGVVRAGEPLIEIGDSRDLEVVVDLLSADAVQVEVDGRVLIEGWGGSKVLEGQVRRVEPYGFTKVSALGIEEQRVNVIVDLVDPPEEWRRLGHGYRVEARVVLWEGANALRIPFTALFRQQEGWAVFVREKGRAVTRRVELGHHNGLDAEIVSGLEEGEEVVRYQSDQIEDRTRIATRKGSEPGSG